MTHETTLDPTDTLKSLTSLLPPGVLEKAITQLLAEQLRAAATPVPGTIPCVATGAAVWVTPPEAALRTGVPVKTIRGYIADRRIEVRLRNVAATPKQPKYLVNVEEVVRVATVPTRPSYPATRMPNAGSRPAQARPDDWARARIAPADAR
jgi:hypothetical protein